MTDVTDFLEALGRTIRAERERLDMSRQELADASGHHLNTIHRIENGQNTTVGGLWWVAHGLDISMGELCSLSEAEMNK